MKRRVTYEVRAGNEIWVGGELFLTVHETAPVREHRVTLAMQAHAICDLLNRLPAAPESSK